MTDERILTDAEMILSRKNGTIQMEAVRVSQCPPQIPDGIQWKRTGSKKLVTKCLTL
jgi:hypothetical protein